jgi:hypothetical protein
VQGDKSSLVLSVNVCPIFEKKFGDLQVVVAGGQVEWGTVSSLRVSAVDVVFGQKLLDSTQVTLLRGIQQSRIASQQIHHVL